MIVVYLAITLLLITSELNSAEKSIFLIINLKKFLKIKYSIPESYSCNQKINASHFNGLLFYLFKLFEINFTLPAINTCRRVQSNFDYRLYGSWIVVASTMEIYWRDRWMMGYLLTINWASVNEALISLSKNRIEWFICVF